MTNVYIVGFDGTPQSQRAVQHAAERAKLSGAALHLVFIIEWSPYSFHTPDELAERHRRREQELARADALVQPVVADLKNQGLGATSEVRHGDAGELLCEIAKDKGAAQIVVGRIGDSALKQRLLGGLTITLAQVAPVPVTIVP